ncbi:hypothetical protein BSIN_4900 [Burkholderia singularis]|uniref:Uncharacterized protein n=1 Tax=Burkholderia singularis TaxID=1503053 RepID=A0A238H9Y4_9BURK|nr:hypothetical protein BSIN_4900 [Burkholderia singularis]
MDGGSHRDAIRRFLFERESAVCRKRERYSSAIRYFTFACGCVKASAMQQAPGKPVSICTLLSFSSLF